MVIMKDGYTVLETTELVLALKFVLVFSKKGVCTLVFTLVNCVPIHNTPF